ncbi:DUF1697 domain-containing protein [Plantactinospora endophytica]|uniref:DUF1697 domain-containing protein n=1 Tax=Plantactinospora endophytica TaxID=673535 RepID=A0ABQ4E356_9ACTN|nr:DUF1697 domain-containing protein [Plantactinospora endophytica]GIG89143.1 hypothetical protein Pen02_40790 [Plantactinospora endophytica]
MTRYAALLRGVNVGPGNRIGMADLRRIVTALGHDDVRTYLQSGNVVFGAADGADPERLGGDVRAAIADELGLDVPVLVRSGAELTALAGANPYAKAQPDEVKLLVAFLAELPDPDRAAELTVPGTDTAEFTFAGTGRDIYLHYPDGYGRTKFSNAYLEKRLAVASTTRNWRTVQALADLTSEH